jgi:ABC-type nitrate/sulfonate/bicarbonate transport system ATPase subunit
MAEVKLDDVSKVFPGGTLAVDHLSLTVADGEFLVLVGPSGCGKSTVLRIVAGLEDATDGIVAIDGQVAMHAGSRIYAPAEELALSKTFGPAWARYVETVKLPLAVRHGAGSGGSRADRDAQHLAGEDEVRIADLGGVGPHDQRV